MMILKRITKYFHRGGINEVTALSGIDLKVPTGDFITIIGSNGAGKSTLLNCIAGTYPIEEGELILNDRDISSWTEHRRAKFIGRVFQDPLRGTCDTLSIEQNMALAGKRGERRGLGSGVKPEERRRYIGELEKLGLGLENRLNVRVGLLSGGQRQALTMLMAMLVRPEVLLLDEHTAALDPKTAHQILALTKDMVEGKKLTTLMVTHNMNHALQFGNRLIMLHRGKIILDIRGREKEKLNVEDLLSHFYEVRGEDVVSDRMLLA